MDERTTLEVIAPTVEEALSQGLAQLGLTADAVSFEVLDAGGKGLFGLGGRQVRVRLTVNGPTETKAPQSKKAAEPVSEPVSTPEKTAKKVEETSTAEQDQIIDSRLRRVATDSNRSRPCRRIDLRMLRRFPVARATHGLHIH